jgi:5-aminolevulinate synthase
VIEGTLGKAFGVHGRLHHRLEGAVRLRALVCERVHLHHRAAAGRGRRRRRLDPAPEAIRRRAPAAAPPGGAKLRAGSTSAASRIMPNPSHIIPVMIKDPVKCRISDILMADHGIYVQPINYPTVPKGTERLRITPSPLHTDADIDHLVRCMGWATISS